MSEQNNNNKDKGYVALFRSIQDHWVWNEKPYARGQAWIDLLLKANFEDKKTFFDGSLVEVKRGQRITSMRKLAEDWGWSRKKVKKFLDDLESDEMLTYKSDSKKTTYNILNYRHYQSGRIPKRATEEPLKHNRRTTEAQQKHTNNHYKPLKPLETIINKADENENLSPALDFYQSNFGLVNQSIYQQISEYEKDMSSELVIEALQRAIDNNVKKWNYARSILNNWKDKNVKSIQDVEALDLEFKNKNSGSKSNSSTGYIPDYSQDPTPEEMIREMYS